MQPHAYAVPGGPWPRTPHAYAWALNRTPSGVAGVSPSERHRPARTPYPPRDMSVPGGPLEAWTPTTTPRPLESVTGGPRTPAGITSPRAVSGDPWPA